MHHGLDDRETPMAVLVLVMVDARQSGVLYTAAPLSGDLSCMKVSTVAGLGDALVGGDVSPQRTFLLEKERFGIRIGAGENTARSEEPDLEADGFLLFLARAPENRKARQQQF